MDRILLTKNAEIAV